MSSSRPRSLAEELRQRDDDALADLLRRRPDLLAPVPSDLASLAARAAARPSVQRALDRLDRFSWQVVEVLCALPDLCSAADVERLLGADPTARLADLHEQALLVEAGDHRVAVLRTVREVVGNPAGLGPTAADALQTYGPVRLANLAADLGLSAAADPIATACSVGDLLADTGRLDALLDEAPPAAREALGTMTWGPAHARLPRAGRDVSSRTAVTPVEWLLARGLLVATDAETVVLPREVGIHLRGGRVHRAPEPSLPEPILATADQRHIDRAAAGAAAATVRGVEDLLELWAVDPPKVLRAGGVGVRDRSRSAGALDLDEGTLTLLVEVAHTAGLLSPSADVDEVWLPTPAYDRWLDGSTAERWVRLVEAWRDSTRTVGLAGERDVKGRTLAPLGPDLDRAAAPVVRREVLDDLAELDGGVATTIESLLARLRWRAPRQGGRLLGDLVTWTVGESQLLGLTAAGALAGYARVLVRGDTARAGELLTALLPPLLDHVLVQADLTAVAPGPLTSDLAARLRLVADVESTGGATVYRFTPESIRRALDAGWSAADVTALLARHSSTPVPQPLSYLVDDVARRHGRVRVGAAAAYVRSDDSATLSELLGDRRAAPLRLRRLAPTVLAAQTAPETLLDRLRALGYAPAAEGADGDVVVRRPQSRRTTTSRRPVPTPVAATAPADGLLDAAVRSIRAGDRAATVPTGRPAADVLAMVTAAAGAGESLWIGYVDAEGRFTQRVVEPLSVEGGHVSAYDHLRAATRSFALHRITAVAALGDESVS